MTTSADGSVTPTSPPPATGIPATSSVTPDATLRAHEDALLKIAELERERTNQKEELDRHRRNAKKLADYEQKEKDIQQAALDDVGKANKRAEEAEQKNKLYIQQLVSAQVKLAAQAKNIIDPDIAAMAVQGQLEYDDTGMPTNVDAALTALIKTKPYLVTKAPEPPAPATVVPNAPNAPATPAMNPGRANIKPPDPNSPQQPIPRLNQVFTRTK